MAALKVVARAAMMTALLLGAPATAEGPNWAMAWVTNAAATGVARLVNIAGVATLISVLASARRRLTSSRDSMW